jgi:nucleoside-diphosphate kinase
MEKERGAAMERTLVILKPDAVQRRLCGKIIEAVERKGLKIIALKMMVLSRELVEKHYEAHRQKSFYPGLVKFMTSGPAVFMALEGHRAIDVVRKLMGKTFGFDAEPGTLRGDYGISSQFNLIHGSDSAASAERELALFFEPEEIRSYPMIDDAWMAGDG